MLLGSILTNLLELTLLQASSALELKWFLLGFEQQNERITAERVNARLKDEFGGRVDVLFVGSNSRSNAKSNYINKSICENTE